MEEERKEPEVLKLLRRLDTWHESSHKAQSGALEKE